MVATAFNVNAKLLVATTDSDPDTSTAGTYAISGTTITITKSSHGYSAGSFVNVDFTSGTGVDGDYEIQSVTTNTFILTSATSLTTSGNCTFSAEFSEFNPFVNGTYVARGFKFRCEMDSDDPAQSIEIDQLGYTAEIESRTETSLGNAGHLLVDLLLLGLPQNLLPLQIVSSQVSQVLALQQILFYHQLV
ncbi:MAG: hypothetical protein CM15mV65_170 [Caudoviricetes sp.]|nr:MAG: hypothetical protein CM15mV65_170 [Caudoviricetes sp.]